MAESFAARRPSSATDVRDPIVFGAVASNGKILIRTGTAWAVKKPVLTRLCFAQFLFQTTTLSDRDFNIAKRLF